MWRLWGLFMLPLLLTGTAMQNSSAQNAVRNASMEEGSDTPAEWLFWTQTTGRGVWDEQVAHSGRRSLRIDGSNSNDNWSQRNIPIQPGLLYRFRAWLRQERCYPWGPDVVVIAKDAEGRSLQSWQFRGRRGTRNWYPLEGYFVPPENAVTLQIELRVLLLPGRVWFDDVAIEPVGSWQARKESVDPAAEWQRKSRYLRTLSTEVTTPHWQWATRLAKPPVVLFAIDRIAQREIVELAQRFPLPWRTTFLTLDTNIPRFLTGEYYDVLWQEDLHRAMDETLQEPADVIVLSGRIWDTLTDAQREAILQKVHQGMALVQIGKPTNAEGTNALLEALGITLTKEEVSARAATPEQGVLSAFPKALPAVDIHVVQVSSGNVLAEAMDESGRRHPLLVSGKYGNGNTLFIAYRSEAVVGELFGAGLTPIAPATGWRDLHWHYHEYFLASLARWLLDVAQPERWRVDGIRTQLGGAHVQASVDLPPLEKPLQLQWRWRDKFSRLVMEESETVAPSAASRTVSMRVPAARFPAGDVFVEVIAASDEGCLDWVAASTSHRGRAQLQLALDKDVRRHGEPVTAHAVITRHVRRPSFAQLKLTLIDSYGWEIEQQVHRVDLRDPENSLKITIPTNRLRSTGATLVAQMIADDGQLLDEQRVQVLAVGHHQWDEWRQVMWTVLGRSGYRRYLTEAIVDRIRATGINTWLFNLAGEEWRTACQHDFGIVPIGIYGVWSTAHGFTEYATTQDPKWLAREPCLSSPEEAAAMEKAVRSAAEMLAPFAPMAYCLADENNITYFNAPFDYCFSPHCLRRFRERLKQRYGSLQRLNEVWRTQFSSWDEVIPDTFEQAQGRSHFSAWNEHRAFMDEVFVSVWQKAHEVATAADPGARIALSGTPEPQAYGGYDWYPLMQTMGALFPYEQQLQRHFGTAPRIPWVAGYGVRGAQLSYSIWQSVFNGCQGVSAFWLPSLIEPDLTLTQSAKDLEAVSRPLRHGLGKLLLHAQPMRPQVAIYHSQPSIRAAFTLNLDEELTGTRQSLAQILNALGVPFAFVDHRQVEQGWLLQHMPKVLILPMTLSMSDREVQAVREYVANEGWLLADVMPAVYDEHLALRHNPPLADLFRTSASAPLQWLNLEDFREPVFPEGEQSRGKHLCLGRLAFCLHSQESQWRACDVIRQRCERREQWLEQFLQAAQALPVGRAYWSDDYSVVRDCSWARWELGNGAYLIGILRSPSALPPREMVVQFPEGNPIYNVLEGRWLSGGQVIVTMPPGGVQLWAVLPKKPKPPTLRVAAGVLKPGAHVTLNLVQKDAPALTGYRVEVRSPTNQPLPGLASNLLVRNGVAEVTVTLPYNLPAGSRIVATDVLSGQTVTSPPVKP